MSFNAPFSSFCQDDGGRWAISQGWSSLFQRTVEMCGAREAAGNIFFLLMQERETEERITEVSDAMMMGRPAEGGGTPRSGPCSESGKKRGRREVRGFMVEMAEPGRSAWLSEVCKAWGPYCRKGVGVATGELLQTRVQYAEFRLVFALVRAEQRRNADALFSETAVGACHVSSTIFNNCNRRRDQSVATVSGDSDFGLRNKLKYTKCNDLKHVCQTESLHDDHLQALQAVALGFNTNSSKTSVMRWASGSTLYYYIKHRGLSTAQVTIIQAAMRTAADQWEETGLGVHFEETSRRQEATFKLKYDPDLDMRCYAKAFFPGWQRRVIDMGPRLLGVLQYATEVIAHELGHVLGLRHEFWKDKPERDNIYRYPSDAHDEDSIMNHRNAHDLSRFVISQADKDDIRRFYSLTPGQHEDIFIKEVVPPPAVESGLVPAQIVRRDGCAPAIGRNSVP